MTRILLLGTLAGSLLFSLAWAILGAISPGYHLFDIVIEPYSPISQPVSGLGLGVTAPWMNSAFVIGGLLLVAGVVGLSRVWPTTWLKRTSLVLLGLSGVGMILDGIFTLESVMLHLLGFLLAVPVASVGFLIAGISLRPHWRAASTWLLIAAPVALALFALFMVIFDPYSAGSNTGYAGLVQRILITVVLATHSALAVTALRRVAQAARASTV